MVSCSHWGMFPATWGMIADARSQVRQMMLDALLLQSVPRFGSQSANCMYQYLNFGELS